LQYNNGMSEQIPIPVSPELYQRLTAVARRRNLPLAQLLENAVTLVEANAKSLPETDEADKAMAQEIQAYQRLHPQLFPQYAGHYVAIYQGQLVDADMDEQALFTRIASRYPTEIVLLRRVTATPEPPELRVFSPRFVTNAL
jgi:hypothetical protein